MKSRRSISRITKLKVYAEKGNNCWYCGEDLSVFEEIAVVDHIIPYVKCRDNDITNIVPCCKSCNMSKKALSLENFRKKIANLTKSEKYIFYFEKNLHKASNVAKETIELHDYFSKMYQ